MAVKFTEEELRTMHFALEQHYGEPVRPVSEYCKALETWKDCIQKLNATKPHQDEKVGTIMGYQGAEYHQHLDHIYVDIKKSNLLFRLIYVGEDFRPVRCPVHDGRIHFDTTIPCPNGCDHTGWCFEPEKEKQ